VIVARTAGSGSVRARTAPIGGARLAGYTHDGRFLLVVSEGRRSLLLDARTLKRVRAFGVGGAAAVSPTADEAAFGHPDGSVTLLDLGTGMKRTFAGRANAAINGVSFSRDGGTLGTAAWDGSVAVWDVHAGKLRETFTGHSAAAVGLAFSPDGRTLYSASADGSVIAFDVGAARSLGRPFRYASETGLSTRSAVSPDGSLFAVSPGADRVALWRAGTLTPMAPTLRGPVGDVVGLAFSRDGKLVAAAGVNVVVWDTRTKKIVRTLPVDADGVSFSPDGLALATGGSDGTVALYDVRTGRKRAVFAPGGSIADVDISPDGKLLAAASLTGTATVWDIARRRPAASLSGPTAAYALRFSPDGKLLAVVDSSGGVSLWDVAHHRRLGQLLGHGGVVGSVDFNRSGRRIVTVSDDGKVRLWDVATESLIGAPLPGSNTGGWASFFPDGKHVLGVFGSRTGIVWNVDPAAWEAKACRVAGRNLTHAEWAQFLGDRSYRNVCP
jgi:WD40 repeat protein